MHTPPRRGSNGAPRGATDPSVLSSRLRLANILAIHLCTDRAPWTDMYWDLRVTF